MNVSARSVNQCSASNKHQMKDYLLLASRKCGKNTVNLGQVESASQWRCDHTHRELSWWLTMWDCCELSVSLLECVCQLPLRKIKKTSNTHRELAVRLSDICEIIWWLTMQWQQWAHCISWTELKSYPSLFLKQYQSRWWIPTGPGSIHSNKFLIQLVFWKTRVYFKKPLWYFT